MVLKKVPEIKLSFINPSAIKFSLTNFPGLLAPCFLAKVFYKF